MRGNDYQVSSGEARKEPEARQIYASEKMCRALFTFMPTQRTSGWAVICRAFGAFHPVAETAAIAPIPELT